MFIQYLYYCSYFESLRDPLDVVKIPEEPLKTRKCRVLCIINFPFIGTYLFRLPGRMGGERVTVQNLVVLKVTLAYFILMYTYVDLTRYVD